MIPSIYIGLVLLDALLFWVLIKARQNWKLVVATIIVVFSFNFAVWHSLDSFAGWPTTQAVPARAQFIEAVVHQPDVQSSDPGAIYLWLIPLTKPGTPLGYQSRSGEPRAYRLPYSEQLYQQVLQAQKAKRGAHGQPVIVQTRKRGHGHGHGQIVNSPVQMHSYVLPPPHPPRKAGH